MLLDSSSSNECKYVVNTFFSSKGLIYRTDTVINNKLNGYLTKIDTITGDTTKTLFVDGIKVE